MLGLAIKEFSGINNQAAAEDLEPGEFTAASNVDVDDKLSVRGRVGHTKIDSDACHSLYGLTDALYYCAGPALMRMDPITRATQVADNGLTGTVAYASVLDRLYYSDGHIARTLCDGEDARDWGVVPPLPPVVSQVAGSLPYGTYLVAATYLVNGEESGAATPQPIEVTAGGIQVTVPVSPQAAVTAAAVYISKAGGEILYRAVTTPNDGAPVVIGADISGVMLDGLHKTPPPPGQMVAVWNGRAIVGAGSFLLYSDPFRYERFDPMRQNIPLDSEVTIFAALDATAFVVGTEKAIYRFTGDVSASSLTKIAEHGAIKGVVAIVDAAFIKKGAQGLMAVFATPHGFCAVGPSGEVTNLTAERYAVARASAGSAVYVPDDGNHKVLFALE